MRKKNWSNIPSVLARTVLAFVFVFGQTAWAGQNQNAKDKSASSGASKPQQAEPNLPTAVATKGESGGEAPPTQTSSLKEDSQRGSPHEGITVHGHWTIEVHNRDGSVARHVEFENSLDPGFTVPGANGVPPTFIPGGAAYLSGVLAGQWTSPGQYYSAPSIPPTWLVLLLGSGGLNQATTSTNAPCNVPGLYSACVITPNVPNIGCQAAGPGTSCNLSVIPLGTAPNFTGLQITGSVIATQNGQVSGVATLLVNTTCLAAAPASSCSGGFAADGNGSISFTSSSNFPGAPISVVANQTLAVTVNITFS